MNEALAELAAGFALGVVTGLWLGFKLWRQTYISAKLAAVSRRRP